MEKVNRHISKEADKMVITPGGFRPASKVHLIEQGYHVSGKDGVVQKIHTESGTVVKTLGKMNISGAKNRLTLRKAKRKKAKGLIPAEAGIPISDQWIVFSGWQNDTESPIDYFGTDWVVPPPPATKNGQLIYLFNGIEDAAYNVILQPVLQWGASPAGGGEYWAIANWYVGAPGTGLALHSSLIPVQPGMRLKGVMALSGQSGGGFDYTSSFAGYPLDLRVTQIEELRWANETLECYGLQAFTDYPDTVATKMAAIEVKCGGVDRPVDWQVYNAVTDNGQHCDVVSGASPNGEVDLNYK